MAPVMTPHLLTAQLELADILRTGRHAMLQPQDLPGRYGRVIAGLDRLLGAVRCPAVVAGGWAVWRHGYLGRVTQDVDVVVPAAAMDDLLRAAPIAGFDVLSRPAGRWPKLHHRETGIEVDFLPEGATPGTPARLAPTTIPHPSRLGAGESALRYIHLPGLVELKLAAGRTRDDNDVVELIRANADQIDRIRQHLRDVHPLYLSRFDELAARAAEELDR